MRSEYLDGLVQLHRLERADEQRSTWRQSMASLAAAAAEQVPAPLEGLKPDALLASVKKAFETGLIDDLDFLSASHAGAALYELAAALPGGPEKREIGRRVLTRLQEGDAATFVALATSLALGSRRGLSGEPIRARVALSLGLPLGSGARVDALALALISRRELARDWLTLPSIGSLPERRLAARLLERAAREAARREAQGDDGPRRLLQGDAVVRAWNRLLADREPLVWRHVATARGLLSGAVPHFAERIERDLNPSLTPTEWRRAAASLAARLAVDPDSALQACLDVLGGEIFSRDRGLAGAMILGLSRAAEVEPEAAEALLETLVVEGGVDAAEALVELRAEKIGNDLGARAAELARGQLRDALRTRGDDDGLVALVEALDDELAPDGVLTLRERIARAQRAFAEKGARDAHREARALLESAEETLTQLEHATEDDSGHRRLSFRSLRDLDLALLETSTLADLLILADKDDKGAQKSIAPLANLQARMGDLLLDRELAPVRSAQLPHATLRLRRLRTLLHLVDAQSADEGSAESRERRLRTVRVLLRRAREDTPSPIRRTLLATLARACDALVREEICEVSDVLLAVTAEVPASHDLEVLAEASMVPEFEQAIRAWVTMARVIGREVQLTGGYNPDALAQGCVAAILDVAQALPPAGSPRGEALRAAMLQLGRSLEPLAMAASLRELETERLADAVETITRLVAGAMRRVGTKQPRERPDGGAALRLVGVAIDRKRDGRDDTLLDAISPAMQTLNEELPSALAGSVGAVIARLHALPRDQREAPRTRPISATAQPLPPWLPPGRTLGGFYVLRPLGGGAGGTVFVVKRAEERNDEAAEKLALKVPEYDGGAARTLSEKEFMQLFREEAGALLAVPSHAHLARFVTFDAGAKPKPILVMELVEGPSLAKSLERREVTVKDALRWLDGIAAGLEAMHDSGLGHLDVKPSNVILRPVGGTRGPTASVLVDFGLSGRRLRPGCATGCYGAPEIWGATGKGDPKPMAADVYAFGCVAYEVLTGKTLFVAPDNVSLITAHLMHDGLPEGIAQLAKTKGLETLAETLYGALRQDALARTPIGQLKQQLARLAPKLAERAWPLAA